MDDRQVSGGDRPPRRVLRPAEELQQLERSVLALLSRTLEDGEPIAAGRNALVHLPREERRADLELGALVDAAQGTGRGGHGGDHAGTEVGARALRHVRQVVLEDEALMPFPGLHRAAAVDRHLQPFGERPAELPGRGHEVPVVGPVEGVRLQRLALYGQLRQLSAPLAQLGPRLRAAVGQAGLGEQVLVVVEQGRASAEREPVEVVAHQSFVVQHVDVVVPVDLVVEVVGQWLQHVVEEVAAPERVGQHDDVGDLTGLQSGRQLRRRLVVVALELDLGVDVFLRVVELLDELVQRLAADAAHGAPHDDVDVTSAVGVGRVDVDLPHAAALVVVIVDPARAGAKNRDADAGRRRHAEEVTPARLVERASPPRPVACYGLLCSGAIPHRSARPFVGEVGEG